MPDALQKIMQALVPPGTGTDPNTGKVLNDRFHQIRGGGRAQMLDSTGQLDGMALQLVQSRGAPPTQQNVQMAKAYLLGDPLGMFGGETTEQDIANSAMSAETGGARPAGGQGDSVAPPQARPSPTSAPSAAPPPGAPAVTVDERDTGPNVPLIPPIAARPGQDQPGDGRAVANSDVLHGEVLRPDADNMVQITDNRTGDVIVMHADQAAADGWTVAGVNTAPTQNVIEGETIKLLPDDGPTTPPPAPAAQQAAPPTPDNAGPRSSRREARTGRASTPPAQASTEAPAVPSGQQYAAQSNARTQEGSVLIDSGERGPNGELIFRDKKYGGYTARALDGSNVNEPDLPSLRNVLRGL